MIKRLIYEILELISLHNYDKLARCLYALVMS